jgi:hypothetical protein
MKEIFLAIIFMFNGTPTIMDGWQIREYPTMEVCNTRKEYAENYFSGLKDAPEVGVIYCGTLEQIQQQISILNSESI